MRRVALAAYLACAGLCAPLQAQTPAESGSTEPPAAKPAATAASAPEAAKVEITGARFREQAGKASLSGSELARVPGTGGDPMRAIQSLPGVASVDDGSSEPAVRGSRPSMSAL